MCHSEKSEMMWDFNKLWHDTFCWWFHLVHWEGSHSTKWLADQRRLTVTKYEAKNTRKKALGLHLAWWSQVSHCHTQDRDFAVMLDHWVCLSCAQWQGKRKPNSGRCKEREKEKGNLRVPLFHDMLTGYAGYWTTWIFSLSWGCPFHVAYMMSYVYIYTRYIFYCVSIGSTYSQSLSGLFSFCCARGCPRPFRAFLFPQLTATLLSAQWFSRKLLKI